MRQIALITTLVASLGFAVACGVGPHDELIEDNEAAGQVSLTGKADGASVSPCVTTAALAWLNAGSTVAASINDLGLTTRAAGNIIAHRDGADAVFGTADDDLFDDLLELDRVAYVGPKSIGRITDSVKGSCTGGGGSDPDPACVTRAALAWLNSASSTVAVIDALSGVSSTAAKNIVAHRDGPDAAFGTADDDLFDDLAELDRVAYVGPATIGYHQSLGGGAVLGQRRRQRRRGLLAAELQRQPHPAHHQGHRRSADLAGHRHVQPLRRQRRKGAVARDWPRRLRPRGHRQRQRRPQRPAAGSKSARLEDLGINVRYVNKIMHHKFMLVDGPKAGSNAVAAAATLVSGSGNWSSGAATRYDENTLFLSGVAELALRYQREFNLLWNGSRDFVWDSTLPYAYAAALDLGAMVDDPAQHALFTSDNFKITGSDGTTFTKVSGRNAVSDAIVTEIKAAKTSIHVASGHLRSRPIAEALLAAKQANPALDVKVYLDGQEYISSSTHKLQLSDLTKCLAAAGTSVSKTQACMDKGFYFSYQLQAAGIDLKFKYYAYRWNYNYAKQMHHKYLLIDGDDAADRLVQPERQRRAQHLRERGGAAGAGVFGADQKVRAELRRHVGAGRLGRQAGRAEAEDQQLQRDPAGLRRHGADPAPGPGPQEPDRRQLRRRQQLRLPQEPREAHGLLPVAVGDQRSRSRSSRSRSSSIFLLRRALLKRRR